VFDESKRTKIKLIRDWEKGERIPLLMRRYNVSRPNVYRWINSRAAP